MARPYTPRPLFENPSPGLKKTGFGQTIHLVLTLFSIALVQLLLCTNKGTIWYYFHGGAKAIW